MWARASPLVRGNAIKDGVTRPETATGGDARPPLKLELGFAVFLSNQGQRGHVVVDRRLLHELLHALDHARA